MNKLKGILILVFALAVVAVFSGASVFASATGETTDQVACSECEDGLGPKVLPNCDGKTGDELTACQNPPKTKENKAGKVQ